MFGYGYCPVIKVDRFICRRVEGLGQGKVKGRDVFKKSFLLGFWKLSPVLETQKLIFRQNAIARTEMKIVTVPLLFGVFVTSLLGCAKNYSFETADEVMGKTTISRDRIRNVTTIKGPYAETPNKDALYLLTARYTKGQMVSCQLLIYQQRLRTKGPAFYYQAFDPNGNKMEFSRFVDTFSDSDEKVGIMISKSRLQASRERGMEFILYGKRDELSLRVDPFYIQGFLAKAEEAG